LVQNTTRGFVYLNGKIINYFLLSIIITVLAVHFVFDLKFKTELIQTNNYDQPVYQKPFYGYCKVPGIAYPAEQNLITTGNSKLDYIWKDMAIIPYEPSKINNPLGADFSQVYLSAMSLRNGDSQYNPSNVNFKVLFVRKPNYPPLTNWLYTPLTFLDYHVALIVHNFLSLGIFLILALIILKKFKLQTYSIKFLAFFLLLYFYTPLGFSHFERGQFDLWLSSAYLLIFTCVFIEKNTFIASLAAGFFAALKWSSAPFIGTISLLGWSCSNSKKKWIFLIPPAVMLLSALLFYKQVQEYWPSLQRYEFQAMPLGISFMYFLPRSLAKMVQISSCILVIVLSVSLHRGPEQRSDLLKYISFPFALTMFIQGMCYGSISYEYRIVAITGLVPGFFIWLTQVQDIPEILKVAVAAFFAIFIIIAFRVFHFFFWDLPSLASTGMSKYYFLCSLISLVFTCYLVYAKSKRGQVN
jgi:hypothetical protein